MFDELPQFRRYNFAAIAAELLDSLKIKMSGINVSVYFKKSLTDHHFIRFNRFCYLTAALIIWFSIHKS
jgi:hypothetical protein